MSTVAGTRSESCHLPDLSDGLGWPVMPATGRVPPQQRQLQRRAVLSALLVASRVPSGLNATPVMSFSWPVRGPGKRAKSNPGTAPRTYSAGTLFGRGWANHDNGAGYSTGISL
jgi:hypothetical protein